MSRGTGSDMMASGDNASMVGGVQLSATTAAPAFREKTWTVRTLQGLIRFARSKPLGAFAAVLIALIVFTAIFAPIISPYDPIEQKSAEKLSAPSITHLLGADNLGRDILSRVIWGSRVSLWVGLVAVSLGTLTGTVLGLVSGFWSGKVDLIIQRVVDSVMAFPALVLAIAIVAVLGTDITNVMIAIAIVITPGASRIVRGAVLAVRENQYIEAARCLGCQDYRIMLFHVLPNVTAPIIVIATIQLGNAILAEASLSFLGLGTQPPTPSWGQMLSGSAQRFMLMSPWLVISPGVAISLAVLGFNLLGDALRDIWDPRLRGAGTRG